MKYWWVNQGQTFKVEHVLGIMWAPIANDKGRTFVHWTHMGEVEVGDIVINYARKQIHGVSRVVRAARPSENPHPRTEGTKWLAGGREVKLDTQFLDEPLSLEEIPLELRVNSSAPGTAFDRNGKASFGYLFSLPDECGTWILSKLGMVAQPGEVLMDRPPRGREADYELAIQVDETDGTRTAGYRKEHGALTDHLFGQRATDRCDMCGRELPRAFLVTAHIKPRSECNHEERTNKAIVMRACQFGCDALYERGYLVVDEAGTLVKSRRSKEATAALSAAIDALVGRQVSAFSERSRPFFAWHAQKHA